MGDKRGKPIILEEKILKVVSEKPLDLRGVLGGKLTPYD